MLVHRFDLVRLGPGTQRTPQGFLKIPAAFSRTGIQTYRRADGTEIREYRPESEVFSEDSMASLSLAPVTEDHPGELITPANVKTHAIGWVSETLRRDGNKIVGHVIVADADAIAKVEQGKLREISLGYKARMDMTAGEAEEGHYDAIQRDITVNHAALGPEGWGRAGPDVRLRLDSDGALSYVPEDATSASSAQTTEDAAMRKVKINGVTFEIEDSVAEALEAERADAAAKQAESEKAQARADAADEKIKKLDAELAEAKDAKRFDAAVAERIALIDGARKILGADAEVKGTPREIREAALKHDHKDLDLSDRSDDYVAARFDLLLEDAAKQKKVHETKVDTRAAAHDAQATAQDRNDAESARQRMLDASRKASEVTNRDQLLGMK
jgi:uncharacterized protein